MSKRYDHRPKQNPPDPEKMERRAALKAIRTVLRNSISTQATYDGKTFDEMLATFMTYRPSVAGMLAGVARDAPDHPNAKSFVAFAAMAEKHKFNWHDLALRELNLTPAESAIELHRVTRERDALRAEVERLRTASNAIAAIEALKDRATRVYRMFENELYVPSDAVPIDKPLDSNDDLDADAVPTITLAFNISDDENPWAASVDTWADTYDADGEEEEEEAPERITIAFGRGCKSPIEALESLRQAIDLGRAENGQFVPQELRDEVRLAMSGGDGQKPN